MTRGEVLPVIVGMTAPAGWQGARLTLEGGEGLTVSPDTMPAPCIVSEFMSVTGRPLLLSNWKSGEAPSYHMTAEVEAALEAFFSPPQTAKKKHAVPEALREVVGVEVLPGGAACLTLEDGQVLDIPDAAQSFFSPEDCAPSYFAVKTNKEDPYTFYRINEALRLPLMSALGYMPDMGQLPSIIEGARLEEAGRAALDLRLSDGQPFVYRLRVPAPYVLTGRHGEAVKGQPYRLTLHPDTPQALTLLCPFAVWPAVMEVISGEGEDLDTKARAYLYGLPTLEEVKDTGRAVRLIGTGADGQPASVEVLRPLWVSVGHYLLDTPTPADVTFWQGSKEAPTGCARFAVWEDTPQGGALLKALQALPEGVNK